MTFGSASHLIQASEYSSVASHVYSYIFLMIFCLLDQYILSDFQVVNGIKLVSFIGIEVFA